MSKWTIDNGQWTIKAQFLNKSGYTIVEVLISMLIATIVGGLMLVVMVNSSGLFYKESSKVEEGLNINAALTSINNNIKDASAVAVSFTNGSQTFSSGVNQLVLKVPSVDSSGNIIASTFDYFVFYQDTGILRFKVFPDTTSSRKSQDQIFSTSIDSLAIKYFNSASPPVEVSPDTATKVRVTVTLKQKNGFGYETNIATTEANLRND